MSGRAVNPAVTPHTLQHNGHTIAYSLRYSAQARKRRIKVGAAGVEVVVPRTTPADLAHRFVAEHADWVSKQLARMREIGSVRKQFQQEPVPNRLCFQGQELRIQVTSELSERTYSRVVRSGSCLTIVLPVGQDVDPAWVLESWLRKQARAIFESCVKLRSAEMRVKPERLFVMSQRTRWGGCSAKRNLSLNWRLVMAPRDVLDYVVVHELAHLREFNHSQKYWLLVRSFCPEFERHKRWLKENGSQLQLPTLE